MSEIKHLVTNKTLRAFTQLPRLAFMNVLTGEGMLFFKKSNKALTVMEPFAFTGYLQPLFKKMIWVFLRSFRCIIISSWGPFQNNN